MSATAGPGDEALTVLSVVVWAAAIVCESHYTAALIPPCRVARQNSGYNYVGIGLPIAVLCFVKMRLAASTGSMGLLVLVETGGLLAVNGFEQIVSMHVFFICFTWCAGGLAWLNVSPILCAVVMGPQLLLGIIVAVYVGGIRETPPNNDGDDDATTVRLYWAMELYYILSNVLWMAPFPAAGPITADHFRFDLVAAAAMGGVVLPLGLFARWMWPDARLWK